MFNVWCVSQLGWGRTVLAWRHVGIFIFVKTQITGINKEAFVDISCLCSEQYFAWKMLKPTFVPPPCRTGPSLKSCSGTAQSIVTKRLRALNIKIPAVYGCFQTNSDAATKTQHFPFSLNDTSCGRAAAVVAAASDDFHHRLATAQHNLMVVAFHAHAMAGHHISRQYDDSANTTNFVAWCYTMESVMLCHIMQDISTPHAATQLGLLSTRHLLLCECNQNLTKIWLKLVLWVKHLHE